MSHPERRRAPALGVCYYPEHWPESEWSSDARRMKELGVTQVRIGEFAWSRLEPARDAFNWEWLDRAIDTLSAEDLDIMLGTPTATPPKWLVDEDPSILPYGADGRPRGFGSRRHYCFSSRAYRREAVRITTALAERYGRHEAVKAWQTDNEYGCHDTVRSYSPEAAAAFRGWLSEKYETIDALNEAWGGVFWSQEYADFSAVDLPMGAVTELNPSHLLDFYRFSSDQVVSFNRLITDSLRERSPGRTITHNAMGFFYDFDAFALGDDLDFMGWDSYPLGFLDVAPFSADDKARYMRQGHPDFAGFHHDLYRACGKGRWQVLEQQPGPVNWAHHNPAPLAGMPALWAVEAAAHGADAVSYFRWRQAPFAQEQMHAGLLRPDGEDGPAFAEAAAAEEVFERLRSIVDPAGKPAANPTSSDVALVFSYEAQWTFEALPQGANWSYPLLCFEWYTAMRRFGLNIDFVRPGADLSPYKLVIVPSLPILDEAAVAAFKDTDGVVLFGPRTGSKSVTCQIPASLPPGPLQTLLPIKVVQAESLPDAHIETGRFNGAAVSACRWFDHVETPLMPIAKTDDGAGLLYPHQNYYYLASVPDPFFLGALVHHLCAVADIETVLTPPDLRIRHMAGLSLAVNYGPETVSLPDALQPETLDFIVGSATLKPASFALWRSIKK
ncbi:MAG: beta-galactosidase [Pseudomonadota bacterium]